MTRSDGHPRPSPRDPRHGTDPDPDAGQVRAETDETAMLNRITATFDALYSPTALAADRQPPAPTRAFFAYFLRQFRGALIARFLLVAGGSLADAMLPVFVGWIVGMLSTTPPGQLFAEHWQTLAFMLAVVLLRPLFFVADTLVRNHAIDAEPRRSRALAEPLARHPPVLDLLPERLRRPHRQQGDAGGRGDRDDRQPHHRRGVVRRRLRRRRRHRAGRHGPAAPGADRALARRLRAPLPLDDAATSTASPRRSPRRAR